MRLFPLRLFFRIASRNREVYFLKVVTLAVAFASSSLVILFSLAEFRYDRFHQDTNSIFRILKKTTSDQHIGNRLSSKIPADVYETLTSRSVDSFALSRVTIMNSMTVSGDPERIFSGKVHAADATIKDIFSFKVLHGSIEDFGKNDRQAILSASVAQHLFGSVQANGKNINVYSIDDTVQCQVAAVYDDFPQNSHEEFNIFIRFEKATVQFLGFNVRESGIYGRAFASDIGFADEKLLRTINTQGVHYFFQPLAEIYFGPRVLGEDSIHGDKYSIWILLSLAGLILFLALTSYVNLTSLTLPHRSKELAVRKLAGTNQFGLLFIFFRESVFVVGVSFLLGGSLLFFTAGWTGTILSVDLGKLVTHHTETLFAIIAGIFFFLTLSPLFLTFKFIRASPTRLLSTDTITFPRFKKTITVLQLGISIFLIVASLVIKRQINYSLLKEPGRNYDQVVYLPFPDDLTSEGLSRTRAGWQMYHPNIVNVIGLSQLPDRINSKEINSQFYTLAVDPAFPEFFQLNMVRGTWFRPNTGEYFFVVNEPGIGKVSVADYPKVIGVIEDISNLFNQPQKPIKFQVKDFHYNYVCVRILEVDIRRTINYLSGYFNDAPVYVLDKRFEEWLNYQDRLNALSNLLGIISALLSCCAIYGLSVSIVRDKLKQIAVHKIFGANSQNIALLLARQFVKQLIIAIVIFGPLTYLSVAEFLRSFVYATHFQWQDPVLPVLYCVGVIVMLCGFQALTLNRNQLASALKG